MKMLVLLFSWGLISVCGLYNVFIYFEVDIYVAIYKLLN